MMSRWILGRVLALVGALGLPAGSAGAERLNTTVFPTEAAARSYLLSNPTGPLAKAAFLALVEFRLMRENGLSRSQAIAVFGSGRRTAGPAPQGSGESTRQPTTPAY
jgi:hypothetical protein